MPDRVTAIGGFALLIGFLPVQRFRQAESTAKGLVTSTHDFPKSSETRHAGIAE